MPRKGNVIKRDVLLDPIYNSKLVTRLINKIMLDGKRNSTTNSVCCIQKLKQNKS